MKTFTITAAATWYSIEVKKLPSGATQLKIKEPDGHKAEIILNSTEVGELMELLQQLT